MKVITSRLKRIESINKIKTKLLNTQINIEFTREKEETHTVTTNCSYFTNDVGNFKNNTEKFQWCKEVNQNFFWDV